MTTRNRSSIPGSRRQRGQFSVLFAFSIPVLVGVMAMVVDLGHYGQVQSHLQSAADSAALAAVRDLNGTPAGFVLARQSAKQYGAQHGANGAKLALNLNATNDPTGDIVLGTWNPVARDFTAATALTPPASVNAVEVKARTASAGGAVAPFLAQVFGAGSKSLSTKAIAVGSSPSNCQFPMAVASCQLTDVNGNFQCPAFFTWAGGAWGWPCAGDGGTTSCSAGAPTAGGVQTAIHDALTGKQPSASGGSVYTTTGQYLDAQGVAEINAAVAAAGPGGLIVSVPVTQLNDCKAPLVAGAKPIVAYVKVKINSATQGGGISVIQAAPADCAQMGADFAAGVGVGYSSDLSLVH